MRPRIRPHVAVDASQCLGTRSLPQHSPRQTRPRVQTKRTRPDSSHGKAVRLSKSNGFLFLVTANLLILTATNVLFAVLASPTEACRSAHVKTDQTATGGQPGAIHLSAGLLSAYQF